MGLRAIIMALMGLAGSGVSFFRPYAGLLFLGVFYFFRPDVWSDFVTPVKWLTVAVLIGYVLKERHREPVLRGAGWLLALLAWCVLSSIASADIGAEGWERLSTLFKIFVSVFLVQKLCTTPSRVAGFVAALLVGSLWTVKVCLVSWYLGGFGDERVDADAGQAGGANYIAWSLVAMLGFLYYKALYGRSWQRWACLGAIPLFVVGVMSTGSRGGLLCLLASGGMFLLLTRRIKVILGCAAAAMLFLTFAPAGYMERMSTITTDPMKMDESTLSRWQNIEIGRRIMADHPVLGTGLMTFPFVKHRHLPPNYVGGKTQVAHNTYVQLGSELGLPMLGAFVLMNLLLAWRLLRRRRLKDPEQDDLLNWMRVGTLCAIVATWVQMTKSDMAQVDLLWWLYGIAFICHRLGQVRQEPDGMKGGEAHEHGSSGRNNGSVRGVRVQVGDSRAARASATGQRRHGGRHVPSHRQAGVGKHAALGGVDTRAG